MSRDLAGELLGYVLIIAAGLAFAVWFFNLPIDSQQQVVDRIFGLATLVLAQPGVFAAAKIATNQRLILRKRICWALLVFTVFALAIPMAISNWLSPLFVVPHLNGMS